jgi:hypothetical protein
VLAAGRSEAGCPAEVLGQKSIRQMGRFIAAAKVTQAGEGTGRLPAGTRTRWRIANVGGNQSRGGTVWIHPEQPRSGRPTKGRSHSIQIHLRCSSHIFTSCVSTT